MRHFAFLTTLLAFAANNQVAQADDSIKIKARAEIGFEIEKFKDGESRYDAEIEVESKRKLGASGNLSLRADDENQIFLQDIYIDKKFEDSPYSLEFGKYKKKLGLEWSTSDRDRNTIKRSYIYQKLEEFAYVGRETILRFQRKDKEGTNASVTLGYAESTDANIHLHFDTPVFGKSRVGNWSLIQLDKVDAKRQLVWANILSLWSREDDFQYEVELFAGVDPFETEFERTFGDGRDVYFYGAKSQFSYAFQVGEKEIIRPYFHIAHFVHDSKHTDHNTYEGILGSKYELDDLHFSLEISVIGTNSEIEPERRVYDDSNMRGEVAIYF